MLSKNGFFAQMVRDYIYFVKDHKKEIASVLMKCKLEEDARAEEAYNRYLSEKEAAIRETLEREQKLRDEFVAKEIKRIMEILKEEARQERERELLRQKKLLKVTF